MKKMKLLMCTMCVWGVILCMLVSCSKEEISNMNTTGKNPQELSINNTSSLSNILKNTYSLQEFLDYFGEFPPNEVSMYDQSGSGKYFTIEDVHSHFPIECIRQNGDFVFYSVYNVTEGGYFYIFWGNKWGPPCTANIISPNTSVYFVTYISSLREISEFSEIKEEHSTAEDVAQIDPALEISFLLSSGIRSFTILNDGMLLEIQYTHNNEIKARNDLIVKNIRILSKENAQSASYLASIYTQDLP